MPRDAFTFRITERFRQQVNIQLAAPPTGLQTPLPRARIAVAEDVSLMRITLSSATVLLRPDSPTRVERGQVLLLRFRSSETATDFDLLARVQFIHGMSEHRELLLELKPPEEDRGLIARKLTSLFNQRRAYRVQPPPNQPIPVHVQRRGGKGPLHAELLDISVTGMGLWLSPEDADALAIGTSLRLRLRLPSSPELLYVRGVVRNVHVPRARVGVEIVLTQLSYVVQSAITDYVMQRQLAVRRTEGVEVKRRA